MANDGALLVARGSAASGEQPNGIAQQYQKAAITAVTNIHPTDTSMQVTLGGPVLTVIGTVPPGRPGITQISGVIQRATDLISNQLPLGNTLTSTASQGVPPVSTGNPPTENAAQHASVGLSLAPNHE